jgi:hypothetical protein
MSPLAILDAIRSHRSSVQTRLQTLRLEMTAVEKEVEELAIAERVVQRLTAMMGANGRASAHSDNGALPDRFQHHDQADQRDDSAHHA